jgi:prolyl oligopeptidase
MQEGESGARKLLVDVRSHSPNARLATYAGTPVPSFQVSADGRYVAYGIVEGNSLWSRWFVYDIQAGRHEADTIAGIHVGATGSVSWASDSKSFFYAGYASADSTQSSPLDQRLVRHRVGTPQSRDEIIYHDPSRPRMIYWGIPSSDDRHFTFVASEGLSQRLYDKDLLSPNKPPLQLGSDTLASYSPVERRGDTVWLQTSLGAPRGRLIAIDVRNAARSQSREIIAERSDAILQRVQLAGGHLLVTYTKDALPVIELHDLTGRFVRRIDMPYLGWLPSGFVGTRSDPMVAFEIQGTADVGSAYLLDVQTGRTVLFAAREQQFDATAYVTKQMFYTSKDGTRVPLLVMHKRGIQPDGSHPAWLYAYGARWPAVPWYSADHRIWLELGGVYAIANVRGGGEYGQPWIDAGSKENKQNGIDDYIAAAEWLIREGYSSKTGLVANGGSASGPLAAAALNQRPDLFGAATINYGFSDLIRYEAFAVSGTVPTFGSPKDSTVFEALHKWSPYHNVRTGVCYPAVFIGHGDQDKTAVTWHSYKLAAALQAAQACDNPILMQVAWGRGHTVGGPEALANQLAFVASRVRMTVPQVWPSR